MASDVCLLSYLSDTKVMRLLELDGSVAASWSAVQHFRSEGWLISGSLIVNAQRPNRSLKMPLDPSHLGLWRWQAWGSEGNERLLCFGAIPPRVYDLVSGELLHQLPNLGTLTVYSEVGAAVVNTTTYDFPLLICVGGFVRERCQCSVP